MRRRFTAFFRNIWRQLTSMRTALILLFLLAIGSLPGALLPQWHLNQAKTAEYILEHPTWGGLLDKLGFFDVFSAPWYAAIYLLLALSLVGCITPRSIELIQQWRGKPTRTPRNLRRMPHFATREVNSTPDDVINDVARRLRVDKIGGWRGVIRTEPHGAVTLSAERGYLREVGNLVFHIAVLGLLFTVAGGALYGYHGSNLVTQGSGFCSAAPVSYDNFDPGRLVDGTEMTPFCVEVDDFHADYADTGAALDFRADIRIQTDDAVGTDQWRPHALVVNDPLRISGQRLYLLGHGYVPTFTVTFPNGDVRDYQSPFQPQDDMFTSEGVIKIPDPPGRDPQGPKDQLAIVGVFAPSGLFTGNLLTSAYPEMLAPAVAIEVYRGDLGMDAGNPQSIFAIDTKQVDAGLLVAEGRENLQLDESMTLGDGTIITFTGAKEFVSLQTSYDPAQEWALLFALLLIAGISASLMIKRRRIWYRATPLATGGLTLVEVGGLARTDQAGYGSEFERLVSLLREEDNARD